MAVLGMTETLEAAGRRQLGDDKFDRGWVFSQQQRLQGPQGWRLVAVHRRADGGCGGTLTGSWQVGDRTFDQLRDAWAVLDVGLRRHAEWCGTRDPSGGVGTLRAFGLGG